MKIIVWEYNRIYSNQKVGTITVGLENIILGEYRNAKQFNVYGPSSFEPSFKDGTQMMIDFPKTASMWVGSITMSMTCTPLKDEPGKPAPKLLFGPKPMNLQGEGASLG